MRVFVFEHICGGGLADQELSSRLVWEGGAMLRAVAEDFVALGVDVTTTLDTRAPLKLGKAKITSITPGSDFVPQFDQLVSAADAALIIAPEFHGLLERWAGRVRVSGTRLLGCGPEAVAMASDKFALSARLLKAGVPTPVTTLGIDSPPESWPVVVKPRHGAGCERTYICHHAADLLRLPIHNDWIVQPMARGMPASAAFLIDGTSIRPLQAGQQFISGKQQLFYNGGRVPLPPGVAERALALGERAVQTIPGLHGYVGVDLIMGEMAEQDCVIEINPRLTVAYVGLRKLCKSNLAAAMLDHAAPLDWHEGRVSYDASGTIGWETQA
jgi:predicted ATP-grasp superfamily ATP-dependent carboligase